MTVFDASPVPLRADVRAWRTARTGVPSELVGWTMLYLFVFLKLPIVGGLLDRLVGDPPGRRTPTTSRSDGGPQVPRRPHPRRRAARARRAAAVRPAARASPPPPRIRSVTAAGRGRELHQ